MICACFYFIGIISASLLNYGFRTVRAAPYDAHKYPLIDITCIEHLVHLTEIFYAAVVQNTEISPHLSHVAHTNHYTSYEVHIFLVMRHIR